MPGGRGAVRQVRVLQPTLLCQGPPRSRHHRGGREERQAEEGGHGRRGHLRQHGHRRRDGVRPARVRLRHLHGRALLRRAPQAHAHARREGDRHAQGREGHRHGAQGGGAVRKARVVPVPPVRERCAPLATFTGLLFEATRHDTRARRAPPAARRSLYAAHCEGDGPTPRVRQRPTGSSTK